MNYLEIDRCSINNGIGIRCVLFVSGCEHKCLGCQNKSSWDKSSGKPFTEQTMNYIIEYLKNDYVDGLTLSGGDPLALYNREEVFKIAKKVREVNDNKNFQNAVVLDKEDDYVTKQITFSGLAEMVKEIRVGVACDLNMPITKLFGISSAGFNSGDDDIENYNAMIESEIRQPLRTPLLKVLKIVCRILFGFIPEDLDFEYKPLRILSGEQEEKVKSRKLERILNSLKLGIIDAKTACKVINNSNVLDIQIPEVDELHTQELSELDTSTGSKEIPLRGVTDFGG